MEQPHIKTIRKLVQAGEEAGFSVDQMISLLEAGLTVETLLEFIEWRLSQRAVATRTSRWVT